MLGTGSFAVPTFRGLYDSRHDVVGLVTQPDRTGRGHHRHVNPMKEVAEEHDTPVFQPEKANLPESLELLSKFNADLFVTAAYGQILSAEFLSIPRLGAINVHASLLPKYRGAAPIQFAVINGETETGITIFQIEPKLDAGPILGIERTPIGDRETYGELQDRLAELAAPLTRRVIDQIDDGTTAPITQDGALVTKAPRLDKADGEIPWQKSARLVDCHIRGVQPWPKPSALLQLDAERQLRLLVLEVIPASHAVAGEPGSVAIVDRKRLFIATGEGTVEVLRVQPEGKRAMTAADFLNGNSLTNSARFLLPPLP
jgi:methionyl-tRNA formyltransferase